MPDRGDVPSVLTVDEVSAYLRLPAATVRVLLRDGRLPGTNIARTWRVRRVDVERLFEAPAESPVATAYAPTCAPPLRPRGRPRKVRR
jgi:excisionase family DNA binding protein